jgi:hypothetical protein
VEAGRRWGPRHPLVTVVGVLALVVRPTLGDGDKLVRVTLRELKDRWSERFKSVRDVLEVGCLISGGQSV